MTTHHWPLFALLLGFSAAPAWAQTTKEISPEAQGAAWAAACMSCHGPNGKASGVGLLIGGRSANDLYDALLAFKTGKRPGSVMPALAKGFSDNELRQIAQDFSKYK